MPRPDREKGVYYRRAILGYEGIYFTAHALERMKQRAIRRAEVYRAIEMPDVTGLPTVPGRERSRWIKSSRSAIDAVYELAPTFIRVVTAIRIDLDDLSSLSRKRGSRRPKSPRNRKPKRRGRGK